MRHAFVLGSGVLLAACSSSTRGPVLQSSSGQATYALNYAQELGAAARAMGDAQEQERKLLTDMTARVDELKKPDWNVVRVVVDDSDTAGKSVDFADVHGDADKVRHFWTDEKEAIDGKVAGSVQHAMKQASCNSGDAGVSVGGAATYALSESIDKQLLKRVHARNDAGFVIDRARVALGPQNVATLEKLADDVAQASYLVHVELVVQRDRLRQLLADRDAAQATLDRFLQQEKAYASEPGRTEVEKKASDERILAAGRAKADIDAATPQAQAAAKGADQAVTSATSQYDDALKALREKIDQRKKAT